MSGEHPLGEINGPQAISMRGYFERIMQERDKADVERDKRLDERFEGQEKAVNAALAAAEKAVNAALESSEKAVTKAEIAQQRVNETQNEFRGTLRDQAADLMPRSETELLVKDLRAQIETLRGSRQQGITAASEVIGKAVPIIVSISALVVTLYLATH